MKKLALVICLLVASLGARALIDRILSSWYM